MLNFWIRVLTIVSSVLVLFGYNMMYEMKQKDQEVMQLKLEKQILELEQKLAQKKTSLDEKAIEEEQGMKDGTYQAKAMGFGGEICVKVIVENHQMSDIQIVEASGEDGAYLDMAKKIIPQILENQSVQVDTISGATFSSTGIREAVKEAVRMAEE